jgi:DNA-binding NtrC family response regulator
MCIVIVDDEPGIRELLALALEADGHHVLTAADARECLDHVETGVAIDGAVIDLTLGGGSGLALAERLEALGLGHGRILLMTGHDAVASSRYTVLRKPFRLEALRQAVRAFAGDRV